MNNEYPAPSDSAPPTHARDTILVGTPFPVSPTPDAGQTLIGTGNPAQPFATPLELVALARKAGEEALKAMLEEIINPPPPYDGRCIIGVSAADIPPWWPDAETHGHGISAPWRSGITILMKLGPAEREVALGRVIELMNILGGNPAAIVWITHELTSAGY